MEKRMSEMVERVARAIADAGGSDFDQLPSKHGPGFGLRNMYMNMARAAIEAMREPTQRMEDAAFSQTMTIPTRGYTAMIDAALKD